MNAQVNGEGSRVACLRRNCVNPHWVSKLMVFNRRKE